MSDKKRVLFICTHNAARSQMAQGLLNHKYGDRYISLSAGIEPGNVNPFAIRALAEMDIDISHHSTVHIEQYLDIPIDYVVTVCNAAKEACPNFPSAKNYIHKSILDPSGFTGTDQELLEAFIKVRDEILEWIDETFGNQDKE